MKDETLKATGRKQVKLYLSHEAADLLREAARRETLNMSSYVDVMLKRELRTREAAPIPTVIANVLKARPIVTAAEPRPAKEGDFNLDL